MRLSELMLHGLVGAPGGMFREEAEEIATPEHSERRADKPNLFWRALGNNPVPAFIASITAMAFTSACLLNVGYTYAWDVTSIFLFTPGDYVSLSIPIFIFIGVISLLALFFGMPFMIVVVAAGLVSLIVNWRDNIISIAILLIYFIFLFGVFFWLRRPRRSSTDVAENSLLDSKGLGNSDGKASRWVRRINALLFYYMVFIGLAVGQNALNLETMKVTATCLLITAFTFSVGAILWRLFFGRPMIAGLAAIVATSFLVSMPFTGYSLFVRQWSQATNNFNAGCPATEPDSASNPSKACLLRVLERGVLLADRKTNQVVFEGSDGRRIYFGAPKKLLGLWAEVLPGKDSGFGPSIWAMERAKRMKESREERRREKESDATEDGAVRSQK